MEKSRKTEEIIVLNKDLVNPNKDFEITVKVPKKIKVGVNRFQTALNCSNCEVTCHYPCNLSLWTGILSLKSSDSLSCKVCPGKCATDDHSNELTRWDYVQEDETRTLYDIRKKYDEAMEKMLNAEELKNALQGEAEQLKFDIIKAMDQITHISNLLKKIALRGDPLTTPEYINLIIEKERKEKKPGHEERIKSLGELLKKARLTRNVTDGGDLAKQLIK
ncbi:uncharacterized protein LOC130689468 [Daphnia carinata]|uniref:uncharacterized protein LOC130689468 n=1 Tax=Daphnia carinata TaxID=120202 RepID=UPI002580123D|nr:uncharacterized protein LOC130689468 [Daphnia carinata]